MEERALIGSSAALARAAASRVRSVVVTIALAALSIGCVASPDYSATTFACSDGLCPDGYECLETICVGDGELPADAATVVDASGPDASRADAIPAATCDEMFSEAPGYELCDEDAASCSFNVALAGTSCGEACTLLGTTCIGAIDNDEIPCDGVPATGDDCESVRQSNICICARITTDGA